jgi:hypothetical protein
MNRTIHIKTFVAASLFLNEIKSVIAMVWWLLDSPGILGANCGPQQHRQPLAWPTTLASAAKPLLCLAVACKAVFAPSYFFALGNLTTMR